MDAPPTAEQCAFDDSWDEETDVIELGDVDPVRIEAAQDWEPRFRARAVLLRKKESGALLMPMLCPDEASCEQMATDFATILSPSDGERGGPGDDQRESASADTPEALVARINEEFKSAPKVVDNDTNRWRSVGRGVTLANDTLTFEFLVCSGGDALPSVEECVLDKAWEAQTLPIKLTDIIAETIRVDDDGDDLSGWEVMLFPFDDFVPYLVSCKDQAGCEQMAADLTVLVGAAHREAVAEDSASDAPSYTERERAERIRVRHILVESEADAETVIALHKQGTEFAQLAQQFSTGPNASQGGALGDIRRGETVPEFEAAAFALEIGEISAPVKSQFGWHVILMEDRYYAEGEQNTAPSNDPTAEQETAERDADQSTTDASDKALFDPASLADRLGEVDPAAFEALPDLFGAPEAPSVVSGFSTGSSYIFYEVTFEMDQAASKSGIEFHVFDTPDIAVHEIDNELATLESRRDHDGRYKWSELSLAAGVGRCAHRPLEAGETATQMRCAYHAPESQVLVVAYSDGREFGHTFEERRLLMDDLGAAIDRAMGELTVAQDALLTEGGPALRPVGGWVMNPAALVKELSSADFTSGELGDLIGPPGDVWTDAYRPSDRDDGLAGYVIVDMNSAAATAGLEYWIYRTPADAKVRDSFILTLQTPESVLPDGSWWVDTQIRHSIAAGLPRSWAYRDLTCGARAAKDGFQPRQYHCAYLAPDRQVTIVAYIHGVDLIEEGARDRVHDAAFDIIQLGLDKLLDAEQTLLAGRPLSTAGEPPTQETPIAEPLVDPALVGTWQLYVPTGQDLARLQLDFRADGTYSFTSNNPMFAPHSGTFDAGNGAWSLTSPTWQDAGTYRFPDPDTLLLVGKLGPGTWARAGTGARQ